MSMQKAQRQMPANAGREAVGQGEAMPDAFSDEAFCPRHATGDTGSALLQAALNLIASGTTPAPQVREFEPTYNWTVLIADENGGTP